MDPEVIVDKAIKSMRGVNKFIIDWKYPLIKDIQKSRVWLDKLV